MLQVHRRTEAWHKYGCRWISTHRNGSMAVKLWYLLTGLVTFLFFLPWCKCVHIHMGEAPSAKRKRIFQRLAMAARKPVLIHLHAGDPASTIEGPSADLYKRIFDDADAVVVLSEIFRRSLANFGVDTAKISVIYNPCVPRDTTPYNPETHSPIILAAGVLRKLKGYSDLIKAFAKIADRYPQWRLAFAGSGEIDKARDEAARAGVADRVDFLGWVTGADKDALFRRASLLCLASHAEGFPMAVLDAWSYGLPVVATPVGSLPEFVHDGTDALLFPPGDVDALAQRLDEMLGSPQLRRDIASASKALTTGVLSPERIGDTLGNLYMEIMKKHTSK